IPVSSKDEIGDMALYFNKTLDNIGNLVKAIKNKVNALTNTSSELAANMAKTSEAVDYISHNFETMKELKNKALEVDKQTNDALSDIRSDVSTLTKLVEEQSNNVSTSSSAIEQMTANIQSVSKTLAENVKNVQALMEASEHGKTGLQTVAEKIQEIARDSEGLLEINSVMENIASQTNLLSMNAAIEAAHAGETGKGFAVVAEEIRKLAELSSEQSKTTTDMLKKVKASIDSITKSSADVLTRFGYIDAGVKTVSDHEQNIRAAMEEQEAGSRQILESVGRLKEISVSVNKGTDGVSNSMIQLTERTSEFMDINGQVINGMEEIVTGAMTQIKTAINHVQEISEENNKNFTGLKQETEKFKVSADS
ncbi:MAG: methyl-accepting chemotaxis protein, partial [Spirochaetes bacterium]|nr:methyl-accepting chemotaxis protein [Spirochaetota bacterium]